MKHLLSLLVFFTSISFGHAQEWKTTIGQETPSFSIEKKNGKKIHSQDLKGKVVMINFFATWCPPCRAELPKVQSEIWNSLKEREDFELIILAREEGWDKIDPFVKEFGYTFPIYPDLKRSVFALFAPDTIPRNVIINRDGKIIYQSIGYTEEEFTKLVQILTNELDTKD